MTRAVMQLAVFEECYDWPTGRSIRRVSYAGSQQITTNYLVPVLAAVMTISPALLMTIWFYQRSTRGKRTLLATD